MDPDDLALWKAADDAFDRLLDREPAERAAALAAMALEPRVRERVERLLRADHAAEHPLDRRPFGDDGSMAGRRIGDWILEREIGRGGMAVVWRAHHAVDPDRVSAVKILTVGALAGAGLERFRREQRVLARLDHPHIATLLDAGIEADGTPWLAMRLVDGIRIDDWCARHRLDARARVRLVLAVAGAVSHAHRNLVVHRDIKPSNVLVDADGHVRLLDFGIARLTDDTRTEATRTAHRALSPPFASPQQFEGAPASTADDVFGLGALLYVLLAGVPPRAVAAPGVTDLPPSRARRVGAEPALPEAREIQGDLDAITMRALAEDPARRYPSVEALIEDLTAWLEARPVKARGISPWYRASRFLRRHWAVATLASIALVSLVAGSLVALDRARVAEAERARAEAVQDFLLGIFAANATDSSGNYVLSRREIATEAARRLADADAAGHTLDPALSLGLARVLQLLGLEDEARARAESARAALGPARADRPLSIEAAVRLAELAATARDHAEAERLLREALAAAGGRPSSERLGIVQRLITAVYYQQRIDEALILSDRLLASVDADATLPTDLRLDAWIDRAVVLRAAGRLDEARAAADRAHALGIASFGADSPRLVRVLDLKGTIERRSGFALDAIRSQRRAIELARLEAGSIAASRLSNLARSLLLLGDAASARAVARQGLELRREEIAPGSEADFEAREVLALAEVELGDLESALALYAAALTARAHDPESIPLARRRLSHAKVLAMAGRRDAALAELARVRSLEGESFPARVLRAAAAAQGACLDVEAGRLDAAREALVRARAEVDPSLLELDDRLTLVACEARVLSATGDLAGAIARFEAIDVELEARLGDDSPRRARWQWQLADWLELAGRRVEASDRRASAEAVFERHGIDPPPARGVATRADRGCLVAAAPPDRPGRCGRPVARSM